MSGASWSRSTADTAGSKCAAHEGLDATRCRALQEWGGGQWTGEGVEERGGEGEGEGGVE